MKKVLYSIALMMVAVFSSVLLTACGDPKPESISVKSGTIETTIVVNEELDLSNLVVVVTYDNGDTKDVAKNNDMQIGTINTNQTGKQQLTIKYLDLTTSVEINVVATEGDKYTIFGFEKPAFQIAYETSKLCNIVDNPNTNNFDESENNLLVANVSYKVGDDNAFVYLPIITGVNEAGDDITMGAYTSLVKVEEKSNGSYTELTGTALNGVVAVDTTQSTFDFTQSAVDRTFKITVQPASENVGEDVHPLSFEFEVVDGWNAYSVSDLSRIDNNAGTQDDWAEYKTLNGVDDTAINGIVLHNNFKITRNDLPKSYFYNDGDAETTATNKDSLKVRKSFYTRDTTVGSTFSVYGNYFGIDASGLAITKEFGGEPYGHSCIIAFGGDNDDHPETDQGNGYIENLIMRGNSGRNEAEELKGGILGIISNAKELELYNCQTRAFVTHIISLEGANNKLDITKTQMYDAYSTMLCCWGSKGTTITNSIIKSAGGPTIMAVHVDADESSDRYSNVEIVDSVIESPTSGQEGWYALNSATEVATSIKSMGQLFKGVSATLVASGHLTTAKDIVNNEGNMNFISCTVSQDGVAGSYPLSGSIKMYDDEQNSLLNLDMADALVAMMLEQNSALYSAPIFVSNGVYMTLAVDTSEGEPKMVGLTLLAKANATNPAAPTIFNKPLIIGSDWSGLGAEEIQALQEFFNSDCAGMFYGGRSLGATFQLFDATI